MWPARPPLLRPGASMGLAGQEFATVQAVQAIQEKVVDMDNVVTVF